MDLSWMAWTPWSVWFFIFIACAISLMGFLEYRNKGGAPRYGIFRLHTTRGDRLFISILGSIFIFFLWIGLIGTPLWLPLIIVIIYTIWVFRYV